MSLNDGEEFSLIDINKLKVSTFRGYKRFDQRTGELIEGVTTVTTSEKAKDVLEIAKETDSGIWIIPNNLPGTTAHVYSAKQLFNSSQIRGALESYVASKVRSTTAPGVISRLRYAIAGAFKLDKRIKVQFSDFSTIDLEVDLVQYLNDVGAKYEASILQNTAAYANGYPVPVSRNDHNGNWSFGSYGSFDAFNEGASLNGWQMRERSPCASSYQTSCVKQGDSYICSYRTACQ
jgi:hypothetical protein